MLRSRKAASLTMEDYLDRLANKTAKSTTNNTHQKNAHKAKATAKNFKKYYIQQRTNDNTYNTKNNIGNYKKTAPAKATSVLTFIEITY